MSPVITAWVVYGTAAIAQCAWEVADCVRRPEGVKRFLAAVPTRHPRAAVASMCLLSAALWPLTLLTYARIALRNRKSDR